MEDSNRSKRFMLCAVIAASLSFGLAQWVRTTHLNAKAGRVRLGWTTQQVAAAIGPSDMTWAMLHKAEGGASDPGVFDIWYYYRHNLWDRWTKRLSPLEVCVVFYRGRVCGVAIGSDTNETPTYIAKSRDFALLEAELQKAEDAEIEAGEKSLRGN